MERGSKLPPEWVTFVKIVSINMGFNLVAGRYDNEQLQKHAHTTYAKQIVNLDVFKQWFPEADSLVYTNGDISVEAKTSDWEQRQEHRSVTYEDFFRKANEEAKKVGFLNFR